jgi:hypothetical protein
MGTAFEVSLISHLVKLPLRPFCVTDIGLWAGLHCTGLSSCHEGKAT